MFQTFLEFVGRKGENADSVEEFLQKFGGQSFLRGLYRLHYSSEVEKWNEIVGRAFPPARGSVQVFGYDWAGRIFAVYNETDTVLILEPGTGEAFDTGKDFVGFHNEEIPKNHSICLMSEYFQEWKSTNIREIKHDQCIGYKIPLFLNGKDDLENLEVSDMEVYWEIMAPLINL